MFISAHCLPEAFSLSMSDFHVPEFAHFGKRVVLKVGKQSGPNVGFVKLW